MVSDLEAINAIGKFSMRNMKFIGALKKAGMYGGNYKTVGKNIVTVKNGGSTCTVTFDYDKLAVKKVGKTKADKKLCDQLG